MVAQNTLRARGEEQVFLKIMSKFEVAGDAEPAKYYTLHERIFFCFTILNNGKEWVLSCGDLRPNPTN